MIINYLDKLKTKSIILASSSPRRKEIFGKLGIAVKIIPSTYEENLNPSNFIHPSQYVIETAKGKAQQVCEDLKSQGIPFDLVIGADTCVSLEDKVYGKPKNETDAISMLSSLSGRTHEVMTGVYLISLKQDKSSHSMTSFYENTKVTFASLSDSLIKAYVKTGEPMDKAGAYGIQGMGGSLIEGIQGDYFNVMGFPLHKFTTKLVPIVEGWNF